MSIRRFRHRGLKRLFEDDDPRGVPASQARKLADVLAALDTAEEPGDVGLFPGWRLHRLKGNLKGLWSITITGNWRVVFRFDKGDAWDVDLTDYH
jgi:proteic killer suppression protein